MEKTSCKYPIRRVEVKVDTVPRGCVDSDALNGTTTKNPFDFKHYKINFVALNVDGPLQLDFENAGYIRSYIRLYTVSVRERCIKTKEIPSPERDTLKETPYLDSM